MFPPLFPPKSPVKGALTYIEWFLTFFTWQVDRTFALTEYRIIFNTFFQYCSTSFPQSFHYFIPYFPHNTQFFSTKDVYYIGIRTAEKFFGVQPGAKFFISTKRLAELSGISRKNATPALKELAEKKLIKHKVGESQIWKKAATEIQRLFPIPQPPPWWDKCRPPGVTNVTT